MSLRFYKIRIESPRFISQNMEITWASLEKAEYIDQTKQTWDEFGKRHGVEVKVDIEEVSEEDAKRIKCFTRWRKVKP